MTDIEILNKKVEMIEKIMEALKDMVFAQQTQIESHSKSFQVIVNLLKNVEGIGNVLDDDTDLKE